MLQYRVMNLGKRIEYRLDQLHWERKELFDRIPELSAQALSNLINRDSKRSERDVKIADALKVSVLWLVYGEESEYEQTIGKQPLQANDSAAPTSLTTPQTAAVIKIMGGLNPERQNEVLAFAQEREFLQSANSQNSIQRASQ